MKRIAASLGVCLSLGLSGLTQAAHAQQEPAAPAPGGEEAAASAKPECAAPSAPVRYMPEPFPADPAPPRCLNLEKSTSTCSNKVFNAYNDAIKARNLLLQRRIDEYNAYGRQLTGFQQGVSAYMQCEMDRVGALMPD